MVCAINFFLNPKTVLDQMPSRIEDQHIKVVLTGAHTKQEEAVKLKPYITSTEQIHNLRDEFVFWEHPYWVDKDLDSSNLAFYDDEAAQKKEICENVPLSESEQKKFAKKKNQKAFLKSKNLMALKKLRVWR